MNRFSCLARASRAPAGSQRIFSNRGRTARPRRSGFTLIEMLVSLAITLLMMGAVVTLFGVISDSVSASRALIEISDQLRGAREMLQQDLQGATATMTPPLRPENNQGYFEYIEGPLNDGSVQAALAAGTITTGSALFGDIDDVLMFTSNRPTTPFIGKSAAAGGTIESPHAEIVYFLVQDGQIIDATAVPPIRLCTLYRRTLLVAPSIGNIPNPANSFQTHNDLSVRYLDVPPTPTPTLFPNTLGDLTKRENRFAHYGLGTFGQFPFLVNPEILPEIPIIDPPVRPPSPASWPGNKPQQNVLLAPFEAERFGDDILLRNVVAFDVQIFDPGAPVFVDTTAGTVVDSNTPSNYATMLTGSTPVAFGAFVDLGFAVSGYTPAAGNPTPSFGDVPHMKSGSTGRPFRYDTWSDHYENDGLDEDGDGTPDGATNGLDDNGDGVVDDIDERDTMPPYSAPLRGIKVTIRVYETSSKQVREAVVIQNFDTK